MKNAVLLETYWKKRKLMVSALRLTWVEVKRQIIFARNYPFQEISNLAVLYIFFIGLYWSLGIGASQRQANHFYYKHLLLGYLLWTYAVSAISLLAFDIAEEAQSGTLEQIALVPQQLRPWFIRCIGNFILQTGRTAILYLLIILSTSIQPLSLTVPQAGVAVLTIAGLYGMGLVVGAITLICKKTTFLVNIIHFFLFFFTGIVTPLESLPSTLNTIAQIIPLAHGTRLLRQLASSGSINHTVGQSLILLIITATLWVTIGITALLSAYRVARVNGLFNKF